MEIFQDTENTVVGRRDPDSSRREEGTGRILPNERYRNTARIRCSLRETTLTSRYLTYVRTTNMDRLPYTVSEVREIVR